MPAIDIYYRNGLITNDLALATIKDRVVTFAAEYFGNGSLTLSESDFSVMFHEAGMCDQLTNDIIVRVQLHAFSERLHDSDGTAGAYANNLADEFRAMFVLETDLTVGVSLLIAEIGWGTHTATVNGKQHKSPLDQLRV